MTIAPSESGCAPSNLRGETTYYAPVSSLPVTPSPGKYEVNVADYGVQGVWKKEISFSGPDPRVQEWGPVRFERKENGYIPTGGEVTVKNKGDLPLSVAGLTVSVGGENLNGAVKGEPFVLPQEEKTFQLRFENHSPVPGGEHTAAFRLLQWVKSGETRAVAPVMETEKEIEIG